MLQGAGLQVCTHLRRVGGARVPMVVLIGRDTVDDRVACLEAGRMITFTGRSDFEAGAPIQPDPGGTEQLRFW